MCVDNASEHLCYICMQEYVDACYTLQLLQWHVMKHYETSKHVYIYIYKTRRSSRYQRHRQVARGQMKF